MYFASRVQAGRQLAAQLVPKYRYENCVVVGLNDGGVIVGAQVASQLHCALMMLLSADVMLPREPEAIAAITSSGTMTYNHRYSEGEIEELAGEYYGLIEQEKQTRMHEMNQLIGHGGLTKRSLLKGHTVILVSDGMKDGFVLELAADFLKPIAIEKLIIATPLASVNAVDRMHIIADEICCLSVVEDYLNTAHYYDTQDIPDHQTIVKTIEEIILRWK